MNCVPNLHYAPIKRQMSLKRYSSYNIRNSCFIFNKNADYDFVVVGGGIIGCATARQLLIDQPNSKIALIEKENALAMHQSGNNSGVMHAGIYYQPKSLKAKLCTKGIDLAYEYIKEKKIPYKQCGKLILATSTDEISRLDALYLRAKENGCKEVELINDRQIKEIEPHCFGLKAIWSPYTGIVDWAVVTKAFANDFEKLGGKILLNHSLKNIKRDNFGIVLEFLNKEKNLHTNYVITCAGLQSDRLAQTTECLSIPKIVPIRGEYLYLKSTKNYLLKTNIYPVPDPQFPFLGVHFTPTLKNKILIGPNAILAFKREGYKFSDFSFKDFREMIAYSGLRHLVFKHFFFGLNEYYKSFFISKQIKYLQKYIPELKKTDIIRGQSGVRAQALDKKGNFVDDFVFDSGNNLFKNNVLHVLNAPSPGATSSLAIAKMIVDEATKKFNL